MSSPWYHPAGTSTDPAYAVRISPDEGGWQHTGLLVAELAAGESRTIETGGCEWIVLPLAGGTWRVDVGEMTFGVQGRPDVWSGPTDQVYVPHESTFTVTAVEGGTVALPFAKARRAFPVQHLHADAVPVELRGAGSCSRQVNNFGTPAVLAADSIIACEVYTPAGNWSSYPPHKHDEERPGVETELEEIYYFRLRRVPGVAGAEAGAPGDDAASGFGYQRVYGTPDRPIEVLEEVRTDDVVLVPHGWHGPAMAPPGYDLYYLNVMAGPGEERSWLICDDPAHAWVRGTWADQPVDPRLPFGAAPQ